MYDMKYIKDNLKKKKIKGGIPAIENIKIIVEFFKKLESFNFLSLFVVFILLSIVIIKLKNKIMFKL